MMNNAAAVELFEQNNSIIRLLEKQVDLDMDIEVDISDTFNELKKKVVETLFEGELKMLALVEKQDAETISCQEKAKLEKYKPTRYKIEHAKKGIKNLELRIEEAFLNDINLNLNDAKKSTLLMIVARIADLRLLKFLLNLGASPNVQNKNGNTALSTAIIFSYSDSPQMRRQRIAVIEKLLHNGAYVSPTFVDLAAHIPVIGPLLKHWYKKQQLTEKIIITSIDQVPYAQRLGEWVPCVQESLLSPGPQRLSAPLIKAQSC